MDFGQTSASRCLSRMRCRNSKSNRAHCPRRGQSSGRSVNAAVKSGTNQFHGDLFDFLRNTVMDAYPARFVQTNGVVSPAVPVPDNLKRNQFGGTVGGPIVKNKLFFFYGYQGTRERVLGGTTVTHVPTAATLTGDFTAMCSGDRLARHANISRRRLCTAHHSNVLLPSLLTTPSAQIAAKLVPYLPAPTRRMRNGILQYKHSRR